VLLLTSSIIIDHSAIIGPLPRRVTLIAIGAASIFNGGNCACAILIGHPPYLAYVETEASAGDLEVGADSIGIHGGACDGIVMW